MKRNICFILLAFSITCICAWAEPDNEYTRLARISYMEGNVSFQGIKDVDWSSAAINFPLQPGDRIYTGPEGRAEIEFDDGSVLRLAESTDIQMLSFRENLIQIRILTGLSSLVVTSDIEFEVDTPAAAFVVLSNGSYRFDIEDDGDTYAIVRKGALDTISHRFVHRVQSGQRIFVMAGENSSYELAEYRNRDAWDEWNDRRDADRFAQRTSKYVPNNVYVGVSDLNRYGRWVNVDSYGAAWIPYSVDVSWSPYSVGRWCYRPTWGWTWVSYEPWGWLPYHYGRWYRSVQYGWCWLPGPSFSFNFWSPGLVTFYYGPSWVSWCPLGPGDYYSINNYYYNRRLYGRYVVDLRRLHYRRPGDSLNLYARHSFKTMDIEHFRNGRSNGIATPSGYRKVEQPWKSGTIARERLAVQPTSRSSSPNPDRLAIRSKVVNPRPAVVYSNPSTQLRKQDAYVRVERPEISSRVERRNGVISNPVVNSTGQNTLSSRSRLERDSGSDASGVVQRREERNNPSQRPALRSNRTDTGGTRIGNPGNSGNTATERIENTQRDRVPSGSDTDRNAVRSNPQVISRQYLNSSVTERSTTPRTPVRRNSDSSSSIRSNPGQNTENRATTGTREQLLPSINPTRSTQRNSVSTERDNARSILPSSRSGSSRSTQSGSRSGIVSPSVSSSSSQSSSAPSISSGRARSSTSSSSARSSSSRSSNMSSSSSRSSSAPSISSSRARSSTSSSSARSSSSRSSNMSSSSSRSSSAPSISSSRTRSSTSSSSARSSSSRSGSMSSRSSSRSSSSASSSQKSSSSSGSSSSSRRARSRD